jgi:hypothetical protein
MLASRAGEPAPAVRERLLAEAGGNPLALLELPEGLSAAQLAGEVPVPEKIPLTPRLQGIFLRRIERLPRDTQEALLIAAADDTGELAAVMRAAAHTQLPGDALDAAEIAELIRISDGTVTFRHPLVRSALYDAATQSRRQRAHAALAGVLRGQEHADRRVWHQAMAAVGADEEVAAALEASARRSQARAAQSSAATAFMRAAELSSDEDRRTQRIAAAAQAAWDGGQADRAREAVARVLPLARGELKARLLQLSGAIEERAGSLPRALELLLEGADASSDPSLRLEMLADAAEAAVFTGQLSKVVELAERLGPVQPTAARDRLIASLLHGFAKVFSGDHQQARALLEQTIREADALDDPRALAWASSAASVGGQPGDGLPYARMEAGSPRAGAWQTGGGRRSDARGDRFRAARCESAGRSARDPRCRRGGGALWKVSRARRAARRVRAVDCNSARRCTTRAARALPGHSWDERHGGGLHRGDRARRRVVAV